MVNTAEEAARAVAAAHYPPRGHRSMGPIRAHLTFGFELEDLESPVVIAMIETAPGLANVDAIASVPGVDALYVGPADLSLAIGVPYDRSARTPDQARSPRRCGRARPARVRSGRHRGRDQLRQRRARPRLRRAGLPDGHGHGRRRHDPSRRDARARGGEGRARARLIDQPGQAARPCSSPSSSCLVATTPLLSDASSRGSFSVATRLLRRGRNPRFSARRRPDPPLNNSHSTETQERRTTIPMQRQSRPGPPLSSGHSTTTKERRRGRVAPYDWRPP